MRINKLVVLLVIPSLGLLLPGSFPTGSMIAVYSSEVSPAPTPMAATVAIGKTPETGRPAPKRAYKHLSKPAWTPLAITSSGPGRLVASVFITVPLDLLTWS